MNMGPGGETRHDVSRLMSDMCCLIVSRLMSDMCCLIVCRVSEILQFHVVYLKILKTRLKLWFIWQPHNN